ncbi:ergothioneine biosynthesis protein EgtC [Herbidospora mongoliensis]|uniref:ergothioneine biosynthesis protein EgtC n=1 Tax=Herbidospora mongoliensis TaxID=688067 RepID=UPI00082B4AB5|nr:ergothioneine biosynthesis protein EgtC [Herbidospora mongoliensis]
MCRHAAWLGEPRPLSSLIQQPDHGLLKQSYVPRRQRWGTVNADGFGMGWYANDRVIRYRRSIPMWADANLEGLAASAISNCLIAAVRSASVGMPIEETATAPFMEGKWLLSHNGRVPGEALTGLKAHEAESTCDSAKLAAGVFALGRLGWGLGDALAEITTAAGGADAEARVNLLASDGQTIAATTWGDTLFVRSLPEGVLVASEPLDDRDDGWVSVPDRTLVIVTPDGIDWRDL